jgi:hypothetical protein
MNNGGFLEEPFFVSVFSKDIPYAWLHPSYWKPLIFNNRICKEAVRSLVSRSRYEGVTLQPQTGIASDVPQVY